MRLYLTRYVTQSPANLVLSSQGIEIKSIFVKAAGLFFFSTLVSLTAVDVKC